MSGSVGSARPRSVEGALLGRGETGLGGVSASGGRFVIFFMLFPTLSLSPSLPLLMAQINSASTEPTEGTHR